MGRIFLWAWLVGWSLSWESSDLFLSGKKIFYIYKYFFVFILCNFSACFVCPFNLNCLRRYGWKEGKIYYVICVLCKVFFKGVTSSHLSSLPPSMYSPTLFLLIGYGQLSVKENKKPSSHPSFLHFLSSQVSKWLAQQTRC